MISGLRWKFAAVMFAAVFFCSETVMARDVETLIAQYASDPAAISAPEGADIPIRARAFIPKFYAARDNRPAWQGNAFEELRLGIFEAVRHGFRPTDFHQPFLDDLYAAAQSGAPDKVASFEVVATDAAARVVHYMLFGKVDPASLDSDWNFGRPVIDADPVEILNSYLGGPGFMALVDRIALRSRQYNSMLDGLARYRAIAAAGGWPMVPEGETLRPGMTDPRVQALRQRLAAEGGLSAVSGTDLYDDALAEDVKRFQARHGLDPDGIIGPKTYLALNRTVGHRIDQLRLSLERGRWMMRDLGDDYVLVNIAGARTYVLRNGDTFWTTRSITGSQYRKTPVFRDEITYMEVNPTWTVPASIFRKDKLPQIRRDPGYLSRNGYTIRDSGGRSIPASAVNWNAANPGVTLVQKPGPNNALGLIKFMFPNKYSVYLHDTNNRNLFEKSERFYSSGCIRVQYPFELADLLMQEDPDWSRARLNQILESGKTTRINLPRPIPVLLTYWTAWSDDGEVQFREDIYSRDERVLKALDAPG